MASYEARRCCRVVARLKRPSPLLRIALESFLITELAMIRQHDIDDSCTTFTKCAGAKIGAALI
jgi:hypothetical protein